MSRTDLEKTVYTEVWGDTVVLKELVYACILGTILAMVFFLVGRWYLEQYTELEDGLTNGFALLFGVGGCLLSGIISTQLFKPKRIIDETFAIDEIEDIIQGAGMTLEDQRKALGELDEEKIKELEELELFPLLALIPEGSKNYKAEYLEKAKQSNMPASEK